MPKINILDDFTVNQIAAGEVIERPSSIVKAVENSIDAGSSAITIEIQDGGVSLIRVTDNGEGMDKTDARLCFQRHATSKIKSNTDLYSINSSVSEERPLQASQQYPGLNYLQARECRGRHSYCQPWGKSCIRKGSAALKEPPSLFETSLQCTGPA